MSTDHEALARLIDPDAFGSVVGVPDVFGDLARNKAHRAAACLLAAGWMPRPEPGSPEWQAMVERGARAIWEQPGSGCSWDRLAQHVRGQCINDATACLRAALNTGAPDAE